MRIQRMAASLLCGVCLMRLCGASGAAEPAPAYPAKPIRWISPWPPGGANDVFSRDIGRKLADGFGQPVIVDNRPGAAGTIGSDVAAKAPADGYTLVMGSSPTHAIAPSLYPQLPYDPLRDFVAITMVGTVPNVLVVYPSLPAKNVKELIALAKAKAGQLNFASAGNGTSQHLSGELFKVMTGVDMVHVPYKGTAPAMVDLIAGQVQLSFDNVTTLVPHIQGGKLRALAVTPAKRTPILPEVPTVAEAGVPGYEASVWFGVFAPAGTPAPVIAKLHEEIFRALNTADLRGRFNAMGTDVSGMGPAEFQGFVRKEVPKWAEVVKKANVTIN
ncbi:MAG: tripartite tricarboxylate transporter substrate binding protein [Burkholderiales bacterium]